MAQNGIFGDHDLNKFPDDLEHPPEADAADPANFDRNGNALSPDERPEAPWPPSKEDFEQLRQSLPPRPNYDGPSLYRAANACAPGSHDDFDRAAVADVAADLRSRGGRVSFPSPRRRRTRVRDRFWRWVFSVAEDFIEDLAERLIEAKMHLDVGMDDLDPLPVDRMGQLRDWDPLRPSVYDDYPELDPFAADRGMPIEVPQYDGEQSFANRLYCGVFGKGGIGR